MKNRATKDRVSGQAGRRACTRRPSQWTAAAPSSARSTSTSARRRLNTEMGSGDRESDSWRNGSLHSSTRSCRWRRMKFELAAGRAQPRVGSIAPASEVEALRHRAGYALAAARACRRDVDPADRMVALKPDPSVSEADVTYVMDESFICARCFLRTRRSFCRRLSECPKRPATCASCGSFAT